ncbi:MAG TPA: discoidin domain-containing protein [Verrucomicrobiae bacterium]|nr:discoidin domain-containing protein [Verrucomicrobiae bacterium]
MKLKRIDCAQGCQLRLAVGVACFALAFGGKAEDLVPLVLKLPAPAFVGTPSDAPLDTTVEKPTGKPRPPLMVPPGVSNVALHKTVTSSDTNRLASDLAKITDGEKESGEESLALLHKGPQWVQIDLGSPTEIYAIIIWHGFDEPKVYHGVVAQVADDAAFTQNVRSLFNNDHKNLDNLGAGTDREYFESNEGKLVEGKGTVARYVRVYSDGSTVSRMNEYTEIEVYGRPPK